MNQTNEEHHPVSRTGDHHPGTDTPAACQPWVTKNSLAISVGAIAILAAIAAGCHVLLGATLGEDTVQDYMP